MSYVRALMGANEYSPRALALTAEALQQCPANFVIWSYRRAILRALSPAAAGSTNDALNGDVITAEFSFSSDHLTANAKSYQTWYHRQWLVEFSDRWTEEPALLAAVLEESDEKNYHAWSYWQWIIRSGHGYDHAVERVHFFIAADVWNNSAWNFRQFLWAKDPEGFVRVCVKDKWLFGDRCNRPNQTDPGATTPLEHELEYTRSKIRCAVDNLASWNYFKYLCREHPNTGDHWSEWAEFCRTMMALASPGEERPRIVAAATMVDFCDPSFWTGGQDGSFTLEKAAIEEGLRISLILQKADSIRAKYWGFRAWALKERGRGESAA